VECGGGCVTDVVVWLIVQLALVLMLVATCVWGNQHCFDQHHDANMFYSIYDSASKARVQCEPPPLTIQKEHERVMSIGLTTDRIDYGFNNDKETPYKCSACVAVDTSTRLFALVPQATHNEALRPQLLPRCLLLRR